MLGPVCWGPFVGARLLELVCWSPFVGAPLLEPVCWSPFVGTLDNTIFCDIDKGGCDIDKWINFTEKDIGGFQWVKINTTYLLELQRQELQRAPI